MVVDDCVAHLNLTPGLLKRHCHPGICEANIRDLHPYTRIFIEALRSVFREREEVPDNAAHFRDDGASFRAREYYLIKQDDRHR